MTKTELNKFKEVLEKKQAELTQVLRNREGIAIEKSPDALDEVQNAAERELAIRNLDRESNLLRNVRAALHRIDEGTFGVCLHYVGSVPSDRWYANLYERRTRHEPRILRRSRVAVHRFICDRSALYDLDHAGDGRSSQRRHVV